VEVHTGLWWGNLKQNLVSIWEDNIKMGLQEVGCEGID
jgi:hypothetical protein